MNFDPLPTPGTRRKLAPHLTRPDWLQTSQAEPRGYIDAQQLAELWFHTGTTCNLRCPFCLEGSMPGNNRIQPLKLDDAKPFIHEALELGVQQFSFTGGEPFVIPDFLAILGEALEHRPCLVLTNGTEPVLNQLAEVLKLKDKPHPLKFRISLDFPDPAKHDAGRGKGNFAVSLDCLARMHQYGFAVSIARQMLKDEDSAAVDEAFYEHLRFVGIEERINIVKFPDFLLPGSMPEVPEITEECMTKYHTEETRDAFMCNNTRFVLKKGGRIRVYACTLVDDDEDYDLGATLTESLQARVMLKHHRCYSCFAYGASCSES